MALLSPSASNAGGVWERTTKSARKHLHALIGNRLVDDETLITVICEVEKIVNDRPLALSPVSTTTIETLLF